MAVHWNQLYYGPGCPIIDRYALRNVIVAKVWEVCQVGYNLFRPSSQALCQPCRLHYIA